MSIWQMVDVWKIGEGQYMEYRDALERIWKAGVESVGGHECVSAVLGSGSIAKPDAILSVGKAATPMLEAVLAFAGHDTKSLLITKYGHVQCRHKFNDPKLEEYQGDGTLEVIEAGHPTPDENSLKAGAKLRNFVEGMGKGSHLMVLVSGGASALAEVLAEGYDLAKLVALNDAMLAQGLDIGAMNAKRREISLIKDGRALAGFRGDKLTVLAISDVPGDEISVIGSGIGMSHRVAGNVVVQTQIIANNKLARDGCVTKAQMLGFEVCENSEIMHADVHDVADAIVNSLKSGPNGIYIFGGEPTIVLPPDPGQGGRNQHLALLLAKRLARAQGVEFLVAGTDGSDGPTQAAGGFGDGKSFGEGGDEALKRADAGNYLERNGNLFASGLTGTNVMDLVVAVKG